MSELDKYKIALFGVMRNYLVLPKGLELNKSDAEINKMSYETMQEVLKYIDFDVMKKYYDEGGNLYNGH